MKIKFNAEQNIWKQNKTRAGVVVFELIPSLTLRRVDSFFFVESNIFLSWLFWTVSVAFIRENNNYEKTC